ncbi:glycosyltransferase [Paraburkholderia megapolitana]|uniref:glycosyltransferase n=1 Tax=Paraburkholderia megapolitana TaxID=420953 RepID=UPI0038B74095
MKFLIFTPALKESAIGRMARIVAHALIDQDHEVVVVRAECGRMLSRPMHTFETDIILWTDEAHVLSAVSESDVVIYHIGDNFEFHEGCLAWLSRVPGVVCLHDFFVGHLFYSWAQTHRKEADTILERWYGADLTKQFFKFSDNAAFIEGTSVAAPCTEWIASQATGVITHSHWGTPQVSRACVGPVRVVPLAYDAPGASAGSETYVANQYGRMKLLTLGHVNTNKRVVSVIHAIAGSETLRRNLVYRLVGPVQADVAFELSALANSLRVNLMISGEVDDAALSSAVIEADAICCLRWPSLEAASASTIEALLYGKATIVTDTGFYREIPDDCVVKISHVNEIDVLRATLEYLYTKPEDRAAMADRGRRWAESSFRPAGYAKELVDIAAASQRVRPIVNANAHFDRMMKGWGASDALLNAPSTVSARAAMSNLLGKHINRQVLSPRYPEK